MIAIWLTLGLSVWIIWLVGFYGRIIMATLDEVNASIAAQTQAIKDLEARLPGPPAATATDLSAVQAGIDANTALIRDMDVGGGPP